MMNERPTPNSPGPSTGHASPAPSARPDAPADANMPASASAHAGANATLRRLLEEMIERGASDLHITVGEVPKLRIDGHLRDSNHGSPLSPSDTESLAFSVLSDEQRERFEAEDELDLSFAVKNLSRFRGNVFRQRGSVAMAIRGIPFEILGFDELGLPAVVSELAERPRGLVLVTGPTGSG